MIYSKMNKKRHEYINFKKFILYFLKREFLYLLSYTVWSSIFYKI